MEKMYWATDGAGSKGTGKGKGKAVTEGETWNSSAVTGLSSKSTGGAINWRRICGSILAGGLLPCGAAETENDRQKPGAPDPAVSEAKADPKPEPQEEKAPPEHLLAPLAAWRQRLSAKGFDFNLTYSGEGIGNLHGGIHGGSTYEGLVKATLDFDGEKLLGWKGGLFHFSGLYAHGTSPSTKLVGDLLTLSNIDAYDSPRLFEFWFQQELFEGKFSLRAGQLAADEEFAATEYGGLFLHGTTGWPGMIALNAPTPAYPAATPGVRLELKPTSSTFFRIGVFDGDPDPGDAAGLPVNKYGVRFNLSEGAFIISEAGIRWNNTGASKGLPGTAKLGGWYHSDHFADQRIDTLGLSLADPGSSGVARQHSGNWGIYAAAEQLVYRKAPDAPQGLGVFARVGTSPSSVNTLGYYLEAGFRYQGLIPGRDDDMFGIAASMGRMSSAMRGLVADNNVLNGASDPLPDYELVIQATYQIPVRAGWTLQPTLWWIRHPGGSAAIKDSLLLGLRTILEF